MSRLKWEGLATTEANVTWLRWAVRELYMRRRNKQTNKSTHIHYALCWMSSEYLYLWKSKTPRGVYSNGQKTAAASSGEESHRLIYCSARRVSIGLQKGVHLQYLLLLSSPSCWKRRRLMRSTRHDESLLHSRSRNKMSTRTRFMRSGGRRAEEDARDGSETASDDCAM